MKISRRAERIEPFYVMEVAKAATALAREVAHTSTPMTTSVLFLRRLCFFSPLSRAASRVCTLSAGSLK